MVFPRQRPIIYRLLFAPGRSSTASRHVSDEENTRTSATPHALQGFLFGFQFAGAWLEFVLRRGWPPLSTDSIESGVAAQGDLTVAA